MTTAASAALTGELARAQAWGFEKVQIVTVAVVSGDDSATVTFPALSRVDQVLVCGGPVTLTAQPTLSTNVATLAFTDPAANRFLQVIGLGK